MVATTENTTSAVKSDNGMNVSGKLVFANVVALISQANDCFNGAKENEFVIDCNQVDRIDSAGIALLLKWQRQSKKLSKNCVFTNLSEQAQSLLKTYRLDTVISS